jgi:tRNA(Arg) A34 adenosine deaminase TadA
MREAIRLAREGVRRGDGGPFGAVVVSGDRIVGRGCNRVVSARDPTAHAEVEAIRDACRALGRFDLSGCELYATCEPCPMCLAAIHWARLDAVHQACTRDDARAIGFDDAAIADELALPPERRRVRSTALLRDEALEVFDEWRARPDAVRY